MGLAAHHTPIVFGRGGISTRPAGSRVWYRLSSPTRGRAFTS